MGNKNEGHVGSDNRRDYFRMSPKTSLCASMKIHTINGVAIDAHETRVCIENISAGGMAFTTNLNLPLGVDYTLKIETKLMNQVFELESVVVRAITTERYGLYEYGVTFVADGATRNRLTRVINMMEVLARSSVTVYESCRKCDQRIEKGCFRGI